MALAAALALVAATASADSPGWPQFRFDPTHSGSNPAATDITPANVSNLAPAWTGQTGQFVSSSPAVAGGVAYVGSGDGKLYAFDAAGSTGCSGSPPNKTCTPLWTGTIGAVIESSPAVAGGMVYVGANNGKLYAFDAAGSTNCSGTPKTCTPLWTGQAGGFVESSPTVVGGVVYVGSGSSDFKLYAFDAAGITNCSGGPPTKACTPLWTGSGGGAFFSSPAVAGGVVYAGSRDGKLYAFDAAGITDCSGGPPTKACTPLWTGTTGGIIESSPSVAGGVVYVGSDAGKLFAFDAAGATNCSGGPPTATCAPLWTGATGNAITSSPAVAGGVVYVGSYDDNLYAFDAAGATNCSGGPPTATCAPLWTGATGDFIISSPAVAGGVVYVGSRDDNLYAFDAAGTTRCSGGPPTKTCTPLWTAATGDWVDSSPAVVGGTVYVGSDDHKLYAFGCGHTLTGSHPGSVILSGGTWCVSNASVGGSLTITSGTTAVIVSSTVGGALNASRPGSLRVCSSTITGSVNVSGATGFVLLGDPVPGDDACGANTLRGAVTLSSGTAGTELAHNHAYSNVTVNGNSGVGPFPEDSRTEIEANTISGSLNCSGNTPAPTNDTQPNTVNGARTGQCGASGF